MTADEGRAGILCAWFELEHDINGAFVGSLMGGRIERLHDPETGRGEVPRDAADAKAISPIGRDGDVEHGIVKPWRGRRRTCRPANHREAR